MSSGYCNNHKRVQNTVQIPEKSAKTIISHLLNMHVIRNCTNNNELKHSFQCIQNSCRHGHNKSHRTENFFLHLERLRIFYVNFQIFYHYKSSWVLHNLMSQNFFINILLVKTKPAQFTKFVLQIICR